MKCSCGKCRQCRWRAYYEANREKCLAAKKLHGAKHRAEIAARSKAYRQRNAERVKQRDREYYARKRRDILAKRKLYREAHHERVLATERTSHDKRDPGIVQRRLEREAQHAAKQRARPAGDRDHAYPQQVVRVPVPGWGVRP